MIYSYFSANRCLSERCESLDPKTHLSSSPKSSSWCNCWAIGPEGPWMTELQKSRKSHVTIINLWRIAETQRWTLHLLLMLSKWFCWTINHLVDHLPRTKVIHPISSWPCNAAQSPFLWGNLTRSMWRPCCTWFVILRIPWLTKRLVCLFVVNVWSSRTPL